MTTTDNQTDSLSLRRRVTALIDKGLNNRVPILIKIMAPLVLLIIVVVGTSAVYVYRQTTERLQADLDRRLSLAPAVVAGIVDRNQLRQIRSREDPEGVNYARVQQMLEWADGAANLDWIGITYRENDNLYLWVDVDGAPVGEPFPATADHLAVWDDLQPRYTEYESRIGPVYGFVVPIIQQDDKGERAVGLVEAAVLQQDRYPIGPETARQVVPPLLIGILVAIGLTAFFTYLLFNRPLQRLRQGAAIIASGNLGYEIDIESRDELGDLAAAFNRMSADIARLYNERVEIERKQREWEVNRLQEWSRILEAKIAERTEELAARNEALMRSQSELAMARDQALEASRTKSSFLANMSHELRTPLNAIIGYSEMLLEDAKDVGAEQLAPDLFRIQSAGRQLLDLINDILDLTKIEAGKVDLYLEDFDIPSLIEDVLGTIQPLVEKNGNGVVVDCAPEVGRMYADLTKVRQVLFNLLSNASKFTENGKIMLAVDHHVPPFAPPDASPEDWVRIRVIDSGIGMTESQMEHIFEAFTQGDPSTTRKYGGTGLGLAISYRFCQMMGGNICVESTPGEGSVFIVFLPTYVDVDPEGEPAVN
jgi:signal transduction histidine kinase